MKFNPETLYSTVHGGLPVCFVQDGHGFNGKQEYLGPVDAYSCLVVEDKEKSIDAVLIQEAIKTLDTANTDHFAMAGPNKGKPKIGALRAILGDELTHNQVKAAINT